MNKERNYRELLPMLRSYLRVHGYGPTLREVAKFLGNVSTSHADRALRRLEQDGCISRVKVNGRYLPRMIKLEE